MGKRVVYFNFNGLFELVIELCNVAVTFIW